MAKKKRKSANQTRKPSRAESDGQICEHGQWTINSGKLVPPPGRPSAVKSLLKAVGEKIPKEFLDQVKKHLKDKLKGNKVEGVYIAHDSMGYPRYIGHGDIFGRLTTRFSKQKLELSYFSFFVVSDRIHRREIETIMIRAAGPLLDFNDRKVRMDIMPGSVQDFEPGTIYVRRQYKKGPKPKKAAKRS